VASVPDRTFLEKAFRLFMLTSRILLGEENMSINVNYVSRK
jgi:hypothetical protein